MTTTNAQSGSPQAPHLPADAPQRLAGVASFDVFETVLVRDVAEPSSVFLLLGRELERRGVTQVSPEVFARARLAAERRARRRATPRFDPTLRAIHDELLAVLGDRGDDGERDGDRDRDGGKHGDDGERMDGEVLRAAELDLERALLRANPVERARVEAVRASGQRVVFTSDTYLPSSFVRQVLFDEGVARDEDLVVVSCEAGATKRAGGLFAIVADIIGRPVDQLTHRGNHPVSDVGRARRAGVGRAELANAGNPTTDEQLLEGRRWDSAGLSSVVAGAARSARLAVPVRTRREEVLRDVAADVAAPTTIAYVLWVLHRARRLGLDRLYFLSREGQLLHAVADRLVATLGWDLQVSYLLGSRRSLNLAAIDQLDATELAWTLTHVETNTVEQLLDRVGLTPADAAPTLAGAGVTPDGWERVPDLTARRRMLTAMTSGALREPILAAADQARGPVLRYLEEVGFLDDARIGVVDTSGIGSQFHALGHLRRRVGRTPAAGFLAMRDGDRTMAQLGAFDAPEVAGAVEGWFVDRIRDTGWGPPPGGAALLEMFCTADHGTVLGYDLDDDGHPTARCGPVSAAQEAWGAPLVRATVVAAADRLHLDDRHVDAAADLREAVAAVLGRFWHTPTPDEARAWAAFPLAPATSVEPERRVASAYRHRDLMLALRRGAVVDDAWYSWRQASLVLSPASVQRALGAARWVKTVAGRTQRGLGAARIATFRR